MPHSRPMPTIGPGCHELRIPDGDLTWRIVYRPDADAVLILDVFAKRTPKTPLEIIKNCRRRLALYDAA